MRLFLVFIFLFGVANAGELRDYRAKGVFLSNYLEVQLQEVRGNCPSGALRAIATHGLSSLTMTGCWRREGRLLAVDLEDGTTIIRHLKDVKWCSRDGICPSLLRPSVLNQPYKFLGARRSFAPI